MCGAKLEAIENDNKTGNAINLDKCIKQFAANINSPLQLVSLSLLAPHNFERVDLKKLGEFVIALKKASQELQEKK